MPTPQPASTISTTCSSFHLATCATTDGGLTLAAPSAMRGAPTLGPACDVGVCDTTTPTSQGCHASQWGRVPRHRGLTHRLYPAHQNTMQQPLSRTHLRGSLPKVDLYFAVRIWMQGRSTPSCKVSRTESDATLGARPWPNTVACILARHASMYSHRKQRSGEPRPEWGHREPPGS